MIFTIRKPVQIFLIWIDLSSKKSNIVNSYFTNKFTCSGFKRYKPRYQGKIINLFYSTPSCYVKAVHEASLNNNLEYSIKEDDFLPYATDYHTYWSGYYTSRPTSKRYERQGNNLLQVVKQLASFREGEGGTKLLKQIMGVMQHHDAITGTEKSHVWNDYHRLLHKAIVKAIEDGGNTIL